MVLPYALARILPAFRAKVRLKLETRLSKKEKIGKGEMPVERYILDNLGMITSPSPVYALTLAVFYFTGSYYHLSKRVFGLRYIFTKRLGEGIFLVGANDVGGGGEWVPECIGVWGDGWGGLGCHGSGTRKQRLDILRVS